MGVHFDADLARFEGQCTVEEAGDLAEWLIADRSRRVDLAACTGLHSALFQTLMALAPAITAGPADAELARWLAPALVFPAEPAAPAKPAAPAAEPEPEPAAKPRRAKKAKHADADAPRARRTRKA